jgi:hypothetical protein
MFNSARSVVRQVANDPAVRRHSQRAAQASLQAVRRARGVGLRVAVSDERVSKHAREAVREATQAWKTSQTRPATAAGKGRRAVAAGGTLVGVAAAIVKARRARNTPDPETDL